MPYALEYDPKLVNVRPAPKKKLHPIVLVISIIRLIWPFAVKN